MAGGPAPDTEPATEAALVEATRRAIKREHGQAVYWIKTTRLTPGRPGILDWVLCHRGAFHYWEFKRPRKPSPLNPRQRQEKLAAERAGARTAIITSVRQALDILNDDQEPPA